MVWGDREQADLSDELFWSWIYFLWDTLSVESSGVEGVGVGDVYGELGVNLRFWLLYLQTQVLLVWPS